MYSLSWSSGILLRRTKLWKSSITWKRKTSICRLPSEINLITVMSVVLWGLVLDSLQFYSEHASRSAVFYRLLVKLPICKAFAELYREMCTDRSTYTFLFDSQICCASICQIACINFPHYCLHRFFPYRFVVKNSGEELHLCSELNTLSSVGI